MLSWREPVCAASSGSPSPVEFANDLMNVGTDLWGDSKANHTTAKNGPPLLTRVVADYQQQWTTYATHWTRIATLAKDHGKTCLPIY